MNLAIAPESLHAAIAAIGQPPATPERPRAMAFRVLPVWATHFMEFPGKVGLVLDGERRLGVFMPHLEFAVLEELTRYGGTVEAVWLPRVGAGPELVAALVLEGDPMPIRCVLSGAVDDGKVKPSWAASDYAAANPAYPANPAAAHAARSIAITHARHMAFTYAPTRAAAYLANLETLFGALDATQKQHAYPQGPVVELHGPACGCRCAAPACGNRSGTRAAQPGA